MDKKLLNKIIITENTSIKSSIKILDSTGLQILLVTDKNGKFIGTLSDGDFRRAVIQNISLDENVNLIINKNPTFVSKKMSNLELNSLMKKNDIRHIPYVDKDLRIKDLYFFDKISTEIKDKNIIIMAGGKGSRLGAYTKNCPKPLLKIGSKPILEHIINNAKSQGYVNFLIAINYLGEMIKEYFGDGKKFGVNIKYLEEKKYLGTIGALSLIKEKDKRSFLLMNGDVVANINFDEFIDFHIKQRGLFTLALRSQEYRSKYGVIHLKNNEVIDFKEKPLIKNYINAGFYIIEPKVLEYLPYNQYFDIPDIIKKLKNQKCKIAGYTLVDNWIDIGNNEDYLKVKDKNDGEVFNEDL